MKKPTRRQVQAARDEIRDEDEELEKQKSRRLLAYLSAYHNLPSEHPNHICNLTCDGQDGASSYCARLRAKLFGAK